MFSDINQHFIILNLFKSNIITFKIGKKGFMMNIKQLIGLRIKELRKAKHLSQEKLAEMLDISQNALSYIEMGENFFTSETLEKLATALDVQPNEIFSFQHLDKKENLLNEIVQMLEKNPNKIQEIYKITKAITS